METELKKSIDFARTLFYADPSTPIDKAAREIAQKCARALHKPEIARIRLEIKQELAQRGLAQPPHPGVLVRKAHDKVEGFKNHPRFVDTHKQPEPSAPAKEAPVSVREEAEVEGKRKRVAEGLAVPQAIEFLQKTLAAGPMPAGELRTLGEKQGVSWYAVLKAAKEMKLHGEREKTYQGRYFYSLKKSPALPLPPSREMVDYLVTYIVEHPELWKMKLLDQRDVVQESLKSKFGKGLPTSEVVNWLRLGKEEWDKKHPATPAPTPAPVPAVEAKPSMPTPTEAKVPTSTPQPVTPPPTFDEPTFRKLLDVVAEVMRLGNIKQLNGFVKDGKMTFEYKPMVEITRKF